MSKTKRSRVKKQGLKKKETNKEHSTLIRLNKQRNKERKPQICKWKDKTVEAAEMKLKPNQEKLNDNR